MGRFTTGRVFAFGALLFLLSQPTRAQQVEVEWTWKDGWVRTHTRKELESILEEHKAWVDSGRKSGRRADLSFADLTGAKLAYADLRGANFTGAKLVRAAVDHADLTGAELYGAS